MSKCTAPEESSVDHMILVDGRASRLIIKPTNVFEENVSNFVNTGEQWSLKGHQVGLNLSGSSPPSPESDLAPILFIAIAIVS